MAETDTDTVLREMAEVTAFVKERVASKEELARVVGIVENVQKDLKEARLRESSRISAGVSSWSGMVGSRASSPLTSAS